MTVVVALPLTIPLVVMPHSAVLTFPVALKPLLPVVMRPDPARAGVGRARPVSGVPHVASAHDIPVAVHPDKIGSGCDGPYFDAGRRRRTDVHPDGKVDGESQSNAQQRQRK